MILVIPNFHLRLMADQLNFCKIQHMILDMLFGEFRDGHHGCHLGYVNGKI